MKSLLVRPGLRLAAGVLAVLLAGVLFAPPPARAECGDYVVYGGHDSQATILPNHETGTTQADTLQPSAPLLPERPCSGPMCSQRRTVPFPVVPVPPNVRFWVCPIVLPLEPPPPQPGHLGLEDDCPPAEQFSSPIYHPPRLISSRS